MRWTGPALNFLPTSTWLMVNTLALFSTGTAWTRTDEATRAAVTKLYSILAMRWKIDLLLEMESWSLLVIFHLLSGRTTHLYTRFPQLRPLVQSFVVSS